MGEPVAALVDVKVVGGREADFAEASKANAAGSRIEPLNLRFDCVQAGSDFLLYEIFRDDGAVMHKDTEHYKKWRADVEEMMAAPRAATKYYVRWPSSELLPGGVDDGPDIADGAYTFVHVKCKLGTEGSFLEETLKNAKGVMESEPENLRFDILQGVDDPTKFVLVEVYATKDAVAAHKEQAHYKAWREAVQDFMEVPREGKNYSPVSPSTRSGWKRTLPPL
jgi:autoinducer 2-degrading protein